MLAEFVMGSSQPASTSDPEKVRLFLLKALVEGDHPDAAQLFASTLESTAPNYSELGLALRFFAKNGQYPRAYRWIETKLTETLPSLSKEAVGQLLSDVGQAQRGDWSANTPRWRTDPHAAATWPELALKIYAYEFERFGPDSAHFSDAIAAIPLQDFRERPLATLALAASHDRKVRAWATAELRGLIDGSSPTIPARNTMTVSQTAPEDPALLPVQALLMGWSSDRFSILIDMFCAGDSLRYALISSLGTHATTSYEELVARIAATPSTLTSDRQLLVRAIDEMAERLGRDDPGLFSAPRRLKRLLVQIEKGEKIEAKPIVCR